jgi:hypothetical protein
MTSPTHETTPTPTTGEPTRRTRLSRRAALLIAVGAVLVLALGWALDGLGTLAPATHFANGQTQQAGLYRVSLALDPDPPRAGAQAQLAVRVADASGAALAAGQVQLSLAMPAMDMTPIPLAAAGDGKGGYTAKTAFPMSGAWTVTARVTPPGAAAVQTSFHIAVR